MNKMTENARQLLADGSALQDQIVRALHERSRTRKLFPRGVSGAVTSSAVLFLLSPGCSDEGPGLEPCVVLNKRSQWVKQPGDLCFPGGSIASRVDPWLARCLRLPFSPLTRWPHWYWLRRERPRQAKRLSLLLATGLREGVEEMRVNPLGLTFLGPMSAESLVMFHRVIYPMVTWITRQKRFFPNWEVAKVVHIPIRDLLIPRNYARYRLEISGGGEIGQRSGWQEFPCFVHRHSEGREVLWGATYRIVVVFLEAVFGFQAPGCAGLPIVEGNRTEEYFGNSVPP